jgi:hypothetical protein
MNIIEIRRLSFFSIFKTLYFGFLGTVALILLLSFIWEIATGDSVITYEVNFTISTDTAETLSDEITENATETETTSSSFLGKAVAALSMIAFMPLIFAFVIGFNVWLGLLITSRLIPFKLKYLPKE